MTQLKLYPVGDRITTAEAKSLGFDTAPSGPLATLDIPVKDVHAVLTKEFRPPKKDEWYLSGAVPHAYRAPNDLTSSYHICVLVRTITQTVTSVLVVAGGKTIPPKGKTNVSDYHR